MNTKNIIHDTEKLLKSNPKVNRKLLEKHINLELELLRLGISTKPTFNIEPPLGGKRLLLFNR